MGTTMLQVSRFQTSQSKFSLSSIHRISHHHKNPLQSGKKAAPKGSFSVDDDTVRNNLMGVSRYMNKKGWLDSQGRKGKGYGVYRFANKYGTNVDGYSPIYSPDEWSDSGNTFSLGTKGLLAWAGLLVVLLVVGINLVISTSQLG